MQSLIAFWSQVLLIISFQESYSFILKTELSLLTKPVKNAFPAIFMDKFCKKNSYDNLLLLFKFW